MRMKELRRAVNIEKAVLCAEQGVLRVQQDIARLKEEMELQARLLAAREEQQQLRRAARKERKRHRYRTARTARKEQLQFQREQLTTQLDGGWMALGPDGASEGTVFFRDLDVYASGSDHVYASGSDHVYTSGSDPLFLCFIEVDSDGSLVYEYDDGERVLARLDDDTLTWDDGAVYRRVCGANVEQVQEVTGSMEIDYATGVNDDVDDILGGVRAVFLGGAYGWHVEDDDFSAAHSGHASMARQLMSGGYVADNCGTRAWLYHHYEYIKGGNFSAGSLL